MNPTEPQPISPSEQKKTAKKAEMDEAAENRFEPEVDGPGATGKDHSTEPAKPYAAKPKANPAQDAGEKSKSRATNQSSKKERSPQ